MLCLVKESEIENRSIIELLERAKYVDRKQQVNQMMGMPSQQGMSHLTVNGFQYILQDTPLQVQSLLLNYLLTSEERGKSVVEVLSFIFALSLTETKSIYKVKRDTPECWIVQDLALMGLVEIVSDKKQVKFYVTKMLQ
jgi:hypothetical protein